MSVHTELKAELGHRGGRKTKSLEFDQVLDGLLAEAKGFVERAANSDGPFFLYFTFYGAAQLESAFLELKGDH